MFFGGIPFTVAEETMNDSDKTIFVPAGKQWMIEGVFVQLTTTADVGDRHIKILIKNQAGVANPVQCGSINLQAPSRIEFYNAIPGVAASTTDGVPAAGEAVNYFPLPNPCIIAGGGSLKIYDEHGIATAADDMLVYVMYQEIDV